MRYLIKIIISTVILVASILNAALAELPGEENKNLAPKYKNVDLEIKYDENGTEYLENVDVFEKTEDAKTYIIISHIDKGYSEILVTAGVRITIYDHDTGKILHIYSFHKQ